jgi:hypothetical protein
MTIPGSVAFCLYVSNRASVYEYDRPWADGPVCIVDFILQSPNLAATEPDVAISQSANMAAGGMVYSRLYLQSPNMAATRTSCGPSLSLSIWPRVVWCEADYNLQSPTMAATGPVIDHPSDCNSRM